MMHLESLWLPLVVAVLALSTALTVVLMLRVPLRSAFGARAAYASWLLVPLALLALALPAPSVQPLVLSPLPSVDRADAAVAVAPMLAEAFDVRAWLVASWLCGAALLLFGIAFRQQRFARSLQARRVVGDDAWRSVRSDISPMVFGVWRTRIVLPADFDERFDAEQQTLVRAHEHMHLRGQDVRVNALAVLLLAASWFNPLAWWSWRRFRFDQELACDALVIERHPQQRRVYANAMLKAQLDPGLLPLGCHWSNTHPLHRRIAMLARKSPSTLTRTVGRAIVAVIALGLSYSIWAQKPPEPDLAFENPKKGDIVVSYTATLGTDIIRSNLPLGADGRGNVGHVVNGVNWELSFDIQPTAPDRFRGKFKVKRDGELQGDSTMEWTRNTTSALRIRNAAGETQFGLDVRADILDQDVVVIETDMQDVATREVANDVAQLASAVDVVRQPDGSYRLDNMPKGLSAERSAEVTEAVMPVLHEAMQKNGDAPRQPGFEMGDRRLIKSGVTEFLRSSETGRISLGAKDLSVRDAFLAAASLAQLQVDNSALLSTTQHVDFELKDVPAEAALALIADASDPPFTYTVHGDTITLSR